MNRLFADTSYYVALLGERDQNHIKAVALAEAFHGQAITTDFVLVEAGNLLCSSADRSLFLRLLDVLGKDPQTTALGVVGSAFGGLIILALRLVTRLLERHSSPPARNADAGKERSS